MIIIKTAHYEHKYYGNISIEYQDTMLFIESHELPKSAFHDIDSLYCWTKDTYDWFWIEDIISITGQ
jgi:hypothetical protein